MIYNYRLQSGSTDIPEAVKLAKEGTCPKCMGKLRDLRGTGKLHVVDFEKEGACFLWAEDAYTCAAYMRRG